MENYKELNRHGLSEYHRQKLCYPYTDTPAFKFWELPDADGYPEAVDAMRAWQDGRCGLCGFRRTLVEDHCHESGLVRGLICKACNAVDGKSDDLKLARWRNDCTVAVHMGIKEKYVNIFGDTPLRLGAGLTPEQRASVDANKRKMAAAVMW